MEFLILAGIVILLLRCFGIIGGCCMCCRESTCGCKDKQSNKMKGDHSS